MLSSYYLNGSNYIAYYHQKSTEELDNPFHLQDMYELYFFISGDVHYFIEKSVYQLNHGDLFVINNHEIHKATSRSGEPYDRIVIMFDPTFITMFGSDKVRLLDCFVNRPQGEQNKISLNPHQLEEVTNIFAKFQVILSDTSDTADLLRLVYMIELLICLNNVVLHTELNEQSKPLPKNLAPILAHIDSHLTSDLSLQSLASQFYINKYYLSNLFKASTGVNIHEYITLKRISMAKILLSENISISEACLSSGFGDYSHFTRVFRQYVGVSPSMYRKQHSALEKKS